MSNTNFSEIKKVLWLILFANLFVAVLKILIGNKINSTAMTADGFHSLTDGTSNIIGLIGIGFALRPKDNDHPYGHKKFETLAGLGIAIMLFFVSFNILKEAGSKFFHPVAPNVNIESIIVLIITLIINIFVSSYEYQKGKTLNSDILVADSMHTRSDIFVSLGVLITLLGLKLGLPPILDPIVSLIVAGFILFAGYEIFKSTSSVLVDASVVDNSIIQNILLNFPEVKNIHKIRSRGREDDIFIDLHIMINENITVKQSHELVHKIENKIKNEINKDVEVIIHIEPYDGRSFNDKNKL